MFRSIHLVKRRADFDYEAFRKHQLEVHVPLALALPGLKDYELDFYPPVDGQDQPFDAAAHVLFESKEAFEAALASEAGQAALADLPTFLDTDATVIYEAEPGFYKRDPELGRVG